MTHWRRIRIARAAASCLSLFYCFSSVQARDIGENYDPKESASHGRGAVAISLTMPPHEDTEHWGRSNFSLTYVKADVFGPWPHSLKVPRDSDRRSEVPSEFVGPYGRLVLEELDAGAYELAGYRYEGYRESYNYSKYDVFLLPPLRFTVEPGRITYLGRAEVQEIQIAPANPPMSSHAPWPRFLGSQGSDLDVLKQRLPHVPPDAITYQAIDPKPWERAIFCRLYPYWQMENRKNYASTFPKGVFPWQASFDEFAETLSTCQNVGMPGIMGTFSRSTVAWEGNVTQLTRTAETNSLAVLLDRNASGVKVTFTKDYWSSPEHHEVKCCIVSGADPSWNTVQVGDKIRIDGALSLLPWTLGDPVMVMLMDSKVTRVQ